MKTGSSTYDDAKEVFLKVCDLAADERAKALDELCRGADELRAEVEKLLRHYNGPTLDATIDGAASSPSAPKRVGPYRILGHIGHGFWGNVYLGVRDDLKLQKRAIKILKRGLDTEHVLARFKREQQILASLDHPGIASLHEVGESDGVPYFVMDYVEGVRIDRFCDDHRLGIEERLALFCQVCDAVQHAHAKMVVHRDLKPANILVTPQGQPKLLDFGIAKFTNPMLALAAGDPTEPEIKIMTPQYASPEQARGEQVIGAASDVYSLGVILYELLSGHRPYSFVSALRREIEEIICTKQPLLPSRVVSMTADFVDAEASGTKTATPESISTARKRRLPQLRRRLEGDIDNIVLMAMRKEPERRYKTVEALSSDVRRHLEGHTVLAHSDTLLYRTRKFIRRNAAPLALSAVIALALTTMAVFSTVSWRTAEAATVKANDRTATAWSLASYMLKDVEPELRHLSGSTAIRGDIVDQARLHLEQLSSERAGASPELLLELAHAHMLMGEVAGSVRGDSKGDFDTAEESFRNATRLLDLPAVKSLDTEALALAELRLAQNEFDSRLREDPENLDAIKAAADALVVQADDARSRFPKSTEARRQFAHVLNDRGLVQKAADRLDAAQQDFEESKGIVDELHDEDPERAGLRRDRAVAHNHLASVSWQRAKQLDGAARLEPLRQAHEHTHAQIAILRDLRSEYPSSSRYARDLGAAVNAAAKYAMEIADASKAPEALRPEAESMAHARGILESRPLSPRELEVLFFVRGTEANIARRLDEPGDELSHYRAAWNTLGQIPQSHKRRNGPLMSSYRPGVAGLLLQSAERCAIQFAAEGDVERAALVCDDTINTIGDLVRTNARVAYHAVELNRRVGLALDEAGAQERGISLLFRAQSRARAALMHAEPKKSQQAALTRSLAKTSLDLAARVSGTAARDGHLAEAVAQATGDAELLLETARVMCGLGLTVRATATASAALVDAEEGLDPAIREELKAIAAGRCPD